MARPRKSTLDAWLDQFSEWNGDDRGFALGQVQAIHRALAVAERRGAKSEELPANTALELESDMERDRR